MLKKITSALISVSDKTNLDRIVQVLMKFDVKIISTGGSLDFIKKFDKNSIAVQEYTGFPEILDGRVKTLHPTIHAGLLADDENKEHRDILESHDISVIDLVIVNLYPFEDTIDKTDDLKTVIENIDVGGPTMIRAAAKNFMNKIVLTDISDYENFISELESNKGSISLESRKYLATKAFNLTAYYDAKISTWFNSHISSQLFPKYMTISGKKIQDLRYGENPQQKASIYKTSNHKSLINAVQIQGKELSYNNLNDMDAAVNIIQEIASKPAVVIIKHANPCGAAVADNIGQAYDNAFEADPLSAFGGIIALSQEVDGRLAEKMSKIFYEVIIALSFTEEALKIFAAKKNLRLIKYDFKITDNSLFMKSIGGGFLTQEREELESDYENFENLIVTKQKPTKEQIRDLKFANIICKYVKSNAIVLVVGNTTIGIGAGQMSRVESVKIAISKAQNNAKYSKMLANAVLASDAFFPFADSILLASNAGIKAIIQPGGSMKDAEVIEKADVHGISMLCTGVRHFVH